MSILHIKRIFSLDLDIRRIANDNIEVCNTKHLLGIKERRSHPRIMWLPLIKLCGLITKAKFVVTFRQCFSAIVFFLYNLHFLLTSMRPTISGLQSKNFRTQAFHRYVILRQQTCSGQRNQRIGDDQMELQVRELIKAGIGCIFANLLVAEEGNKEAELGDLRGDGLDVHTIDAVLHQVKFPMIHIFLVTQVAKELNNPVEQAHGEGTGTASRVDGLEVSKTFANLGLRSGRQVSNGLGVLAEENIEGLGVGHRGQGGAEGLVNHVVDNFARGVEGARGLARRLPCLGVIRSEEVFEDLTEELGVEGDVGVGGVVFVDGEVVALQQGEEAALRIEEKNIREKGALVGTAREAVAVNLAVAVVLVLAVEALEEAAVEIGDGSEDL